MTVRFGMPPGMPAFVQSTRRPGSMIPVCAYEGVEQQSKTSDNRNDLFGLIFRSVARRLRRSEGPAFVETTHSAD